MNSIFKTFLILLPISFVIQLLITEHLFNKKGVKYGGYSPINNNVFVISKYSVLIVWTGMILDLLGIRLLPVFAKSQATSYLGLALWLAGFSLLYIGRFSLGQSFRIGVSNEETKFIVNGIYRICRNPMYVGLYSTLAGCALYTLDAVYGTIAVIIIAVHHAITLGEEKELVNIYGDAYKEYCKKVRRYIGF